VTAQAGGWTQVARAHHGDVFACKTAVSSAYGPLWRVTLGPGQTSGYGTVYLSRLLPDSLVAGAGEVNGEGAGGDVSMSSLASC
jgi:hypothetical protein